MSAPPSSVLATSARGATFLICLQVGSRALTFIVNQILLRYLSPELLGVSSQLELYAISVLYFARESLRVALQRQRPDFAHVGDDGGAESPDASKSGSGKAEKEKLGASSDALGLRAQESVNLSYIAIALGPPLAFVFATLYIRRASPEVLSTPYVRESLSLYAFATVLELLIEPCFVVAQQQMLYGLRATAETGATVTRCVITCGMAIWASRSGWNVGVLPFALGQVGYAALLNVVYYSQVWRKSREGGFALFPRAMTSDPSSQYALSRFYRPALTLAVNLYAQSGLKHLLTQGDSLLIALFTDLQSQGVYALASNYGSLLARMLFQPIEESSRGVFGRLLASPSPSPASSAMTTNDSARNAAARKVSRDAIISAATYLTTLLHLYLLLSLFITAVGPTLAPLLLRTIAGPVWSFAGTVLSIYCYYIPLLALNGILEAFVAAVAKPVELRTQSAWMLAFSAGFVGAGYVLLNVYDLGAKGLVAANAVNMVLRIVWSWGFVKRWLRTEGVTLSIAGCLPSPGSIGVGVMIWNWMRTVEGELRGDWMDLVRAGGVGVVYGAALLYLERRFLNDCYLMVRPGSAGAAAAESKRAKKKI